MTATVGEASDFVNVPRYTGRGNRLGRKSMEEKRKFARTEINEPAYVSSGGSVMSCIVRNISPEGAAIDIENPEFVPQHFRLVWAKGASVRECEVAWIQQKRIGVAFVASLQITPEPGAED
jgi:hypothetical protein